MATVSKWTPFDVALDITATGGTVKRTSATKFTVVINASWKTYWDGALTNYGMTASSGGVTHTISAFNGTKRSSGSGSFTGTYSISGNGAATKTVTVTFRNFNTDNGDSATKSVSFTVSVPAWTSYTVKYNANGGSGAPASQTKWKDQTLTLSSAKPTRTGHTFKGWSTSSTATSATYSAGGSYTANAGTTLYAVWEANKYLIRYNANGGTGAPATQTKTYGKTLTLSTTIPTRDKYYFKGWSTSASATSATYSAGGSYTANSAALLYAVWSVAYVKPRITNLTVARCNENGELDDSGTYAKIDFSYACDTTAEAIDVTWESSTDSDDNGYYTTGTTSSLGTSGEFSTIIGGVGDDGLSVDSTYKIVVTVMDEVDYTDKPITLNGTAYVMDFKKGGKGVAFGKPAELENTLDSGFAIKPTGGFVNIPLEEDTDFDDIKTPNTYISYDKVATTYVNCPVTTGTFTLEVSSAGNEGQVVQTVTYTGKDNFKIWKRHYYSGSWGTWKQIYSVAGNVLDSPGMYMTSGHVRTLSSKVSEQPNGIVLVFSAYADGAVQNYWFTSFFIPKYVIAQNSNAGHSFFMTNSDFSVACCKYLYINDTTISGNDNNGKTGTGTNGITYANNKFVLRYVIGV